jgi:acyl carrier protein
LTGEGGKAFMQEIAREQKAPREIPMVERRAELVAMFKRIASEVVEKEFAHVEERMAISELGIDSLGMLEIIGSLERELKIQIPDESLAGVTTIKELLDVVESRIPVA